MNNAVVGQANVIEKVVVGLLCNGSVLLEGFPGTAKTRCVRALAQILNAEMGRVQFTPDLLPSDITGTEVYHQEADQEKLVFKQGPIFANLVLADEINRAPAKVQAALLEAMEERQVTVAGTSYHLPELFMVLATQNPIEQEGTYPLPEAQLDRFLMKIEVGYPNQQTERDIMRLVREEEGGSPNQALPTLDLAVDQQSVFDARKELHTIHVSENIEDYIVALVIATRQPEQYEGSDLAQWISAGVSSRASISLDRAARAYAWLHGKNFVDPDDVRAVATEVLGHRMILSYQAMAEGIAPSQVVQELVRQVAVA